jgi:AcrR family transcriptional regulator
MTEIGAQGWHGARLDAVAAAAGTTAAAVFARYPAKPAMVGAWIRRLNRRLVAAGLPGAGDDPRERLFDAVMNRLEMMAEAKPAIAALRRAAPGDPELALAMLMALGETAQAFAWLAGIPAEGLRGALRRKAIAALYVATLNDWLRDDSADLGRTMAALERRLDRAGRWLGAVPDRAQAAKAAE